MVKDKNYLVIKKFDYQFSKIKSLGQDFNKFTYKINK